MLKTVKINVTLNVTLKKLNASYQMLQNVNEISPDIFIITMRNNFLKKEFVAP